MVRGQDICKFLREVRGDGRVAIGDVGDEVDKVAEGDNACVCRRGRCLQEDVSMRLILAILLGKFLLI